MTRCRATRADGQACSGQARASGFCFAHDPGLQATREAARVQGGHNKATARRVEKLTPASLRGVQSTLLATLNGLEAGTVDPKTGSAMAAVAGAIVRCWSAGSWRPAWSGWRRPSMGSAPARLARLEDAARAAWLAGCDGWGLYWHVALADGGFLVDPGAAVRARVEGSGAPELEVPATDTPPTQAEVDALFVGHLLQYYAGARALFGIPGADQALQRRLRELLGVPDRSLQGMLDAALAIGRRHGLVDDDAQSDRETTACRTWSGG